MEKQKTFLDILLTSTLFLQRCRVLSYYRIRTILLPICTIVYRWWLGIDEYSPSVMAFMARYYLSSVVSGLIIFIIEYPILFHQIVSFYFNVI